MRRRQQFRKDRCAAFSTRTFMVEWASTGPFSFWGPLFSLCFWHRRFLFPWNRRMPKTNMNIFNLVPVLMNSASCYTISLAYIFQTCYKVFAHCTSTHIHAGDSTSMRQSLMFFKSQVFTSSLRAKWPAPQRNFSPSRRWQPKA